MNANIKTWLLTNAGAILVALACAVILFFKLGALEIRLWDEGRNAVNAYEMIQNGKIFIRHYDGEPDFWELKPPLLVWLQALSMKVFGYNEWAVRMPSVLFALLLIMLILRFTKDILGQPWIGYMGCLVLITSPGYVGAHVDVGNHVARTGDHESVLLFFLTWSLISFYRYVQLGWRKKDMVITTFALLCAAFTKSVIGLVFLPGMILFLLWEKKTKTFFSKPEVYYCMISFIVILVTYYGYRESTTPGYLNSVWNNEMLMRYINKSEFYKFSDESIFYYFLNFFNVRFVPWIFLLPVFFGIAFLIREEPLRSLVRFLTICFASLLVIISLGTNNSWYDAPLYPVIAMIGGIALNYVLEVTGFIVPGEQTRNFWRLKTGILLLLFLFPYGYMLYRINNENLAEDRFVDRVAYGKLMKKIRQSKPDIKTYAVLNSVFNTPLNFYTKVFNDQYGYRIQSVDSLYEMKDNEYALFCGEACKRQITGHFQYSVVDSCYACYFIRIANETDHDQKK